MQEKERRDSCRIRGVFIDGFAMKARCKGFAIDGSPSVLIPGHDGA
jgi:hypothetical protein